MPDMNEKFPCVEPDDYANGAIQSEADPNLCVDTLGNPFKAPALYKCQDLKHPGVTQNFALTWHRNIQNNKNYWFCLDKKSWSFIYCSFRFKRQFWYYNLTTHQIVNSYSRTCLTAVTFNKTLLMNSCNPLDQSQKWKWGNTNETALRNWETYGEKLPNNTNYLFHG